MKAPRTLVAASLFLALSLALAGPSTADERVTEVRIHKRAHKLELVSHGAVVQTYRVAIGPGGPGPKRMQGDSVTPVGHYKVSGRIKNLFHEFLIVSYPNAEDIARFTEAKRRGDIPRGKGIGNGIGIHGTGGPSPHHKDTDWTLGCVALDDAEIDEVARRVPDGTPITITD